MISNCLAFVLLFVAYCSAISNKRRLELKELTQELFHHGWSNYLNHAFPEDELDPLQCKGRGSDKLNPENISINDVLGDFALTMVDTLDTIALMGTQQEFENTVKQVTDTLSFDNNSNRVQVFETNIRILGGLLSAHLLATDPTFNHTISAYNGELLTLAKDLADRLLDAFNDSNTGIPFPRVNLKRGVLPTETTETCTAGAGSLILEFGVLSRLTGDYTYEAVAKRALKAVWDRRSSIDLMGNVIDLQTGQWIHIASSTGAGIDSIFEYMLKAFVLFGEDEYKDMFDKAYQAILLYVRDSSGGYLYRNVHMGTGELMSYWIDSLSAFFPGLQVLYGDLDAAIKGHLVYFNIWRKYGALPERFNFFQKRVELPNYPLRPEFIESTYYLYQATKDPFYLEVGEMIVEDLNRRTRVPCGFAAMTDVRTGQLEGRMESFMLSESLKYLYLLFDVDHPINRLDSNFVFTTEGHILPLPKHYLKTEKSSLQKEKRQKKTISLRVLEDNTCPNYQSKRYISIPGDLDGTTIPYKPQTDYASEIVGHNTSVVLDLIPNGYCESPTLPKKVSLSFEPYFSLGKNDNHAIKLLGEYVLKSFAGLKVDLDPVSNGFVINQINPNIRLNGNENLNIRLSSLLPYLENSNLISLTVRQAKVPVIRDYATSEHQVLIRLVNSERCGQYLGVSINSGMGKIITSNKPIIFLADKEKIFGCTEYHWRDKVRIFGKILIISRGQCTFLEKLTFAKRAGAKAVIVLNNQPGLPHVTVPREVTIPSVLLGQQDSLAIVDGSLSFASITPLKSVNQDIYASFRLLYRDQQIKNIHVVNV